MSNSDELRHTDNPTLVPLRLPDTLLQVYYRRRPTLGLLILPSVPPLSPTIRRTARMSILPIEPNLAERARIFVINLDDYKLHPLTPPPSPLSPFSMAAYQRMIAETDPTQREEALTAYGTEIEDRANNAQEKARQKRKEALEEVMLDQLITTRVAEALAAAAKLESQFEISNVAEGDRVKFAFSTLLDGALTWWNMYVHYVTLDTAHATPWSDFKAMFIRKYCPRNEINQIENELWNLKVKGTNLTAYNQRFQELILLCPEMVPNPDRLLERYIEGLPLSIKVVQELGENSGDKRKWNRNHYNNNNPNTTSNLNLNKRPETSRVFTAGQGQDIKSKTIELHLVLQAKEDPEAKEDREMMLRASDVNNQRQNQGNPKGNNQASTSTQGGHKSPGRIYNLCVEAAVKDNNVVNGTFLINNVYASVLFDTGADRSLVSYAFSKYIDIHPTTLDTNYSVELANGKSLTTNTILRGCTLNLQNYMFKIDLLPIELGSFDVIVGMDWMVKHRAEVVCYEKYIRVSYGNNMLIVQGERSGVKNESRLEVISSIRTQKYIDQGCQVFLIQMMKEEETEIPERRIEDVLVVRDFLEVFPEDLPGLPPTCQVEFHIELIPGAASVARAPYQLVPTEMKELDEQLK
ncbi:putative reverse transcriptase domain-containing protein [Tanacetum coccineum]